MTRKPHRYFNKKSIIVIFQFIEQTTFKNKVLKHVHNGSRKARVLRLFSVSLPPVPAVVLRQAEGLAHGVRGHVLGAGVQVRVDVHGGADALCYR